MCGGGSKPDTSGPPIPAPTPIPTPSDVAPIETADKRRKGIAALKYGALSTIKTSPQGISGAGPDVSTPTGKKTLGG